MQFSEDLRIVAVTSGGDVPDQPGIAVLDDRQRAFADAYGAQATSFLVRPDGYIG